MILLMCEPINIVSAQDISLCGQDKKIIMFLDFGSPET